jgi:dihydroneopterin aldolase
MYTVHLHQLEFYAYHGIHEEEAIIGNKFEVEVNIDFDSANSITDISQTINYVTVYNVIKEEMARPQKLIETLCETIAERIHQLDSRISSIQISIFKLGAPIPSFKGSVGVTLKKNFSL